MYMCDNMCVCMCAFMHSMHTYVCACVHLFTRTYHCKKHGVSEHPRGAIFYCFYGNPYYYHGNNKILLPWGVQLHRVFYSVYVIMCVCMCAFIHAYVCVYVIMCVCACVHLFMRTYVCM